MKPFGLLLLGAFALTAVAACNDDEKPDDDTTTHDDAYYAGIASIGSSDSAFTSNSDGGTILFDAAGGSVVINVDCGTDWTFDNNAADLFSATANVSAGTLTVTAGQNTDPEQKSGTIKIMTDYQRITFATVTVNQTAYNAPKISVDASEWHFDATEDLTAEIGVTANADWEIENDASWLSAQKTDEGVSLTAEVNTGSDERSTTLKLTCSDGVSSSYATIAVSQDGVEIDLSSMILTYSVEAGAEIILPLYAKIDCTVDWGDGSEVQSYNVADVSSKDDQPTHTYSAEGEYDVKISGTVTGLNSNTVTTATIHNTTLIAVKQWGTTGLTSLNRAFYSCYALASIPDDTEGSFADVTIMASAFYQCTKLTELPAGLLTYATKLTSVVMMFYNCSSLTAIPENLFANCKNITLFSSTFGYDSKLTGESAYDLVDGVKIHLYERGDHTDLGYKTPSTYSKCYERCTKLDDYDNIPSSWIE